MMGKTTLLVRCRIQHQPPPHHFPTHRHYQHIAASSTSIPDHSPHTQTAQNFPRQPFLTFIRFVDARASPVHNSRLPHARLLTPPIRDCLSPVWSTAITSLPQTSLLLNNRVKV